MPDLRPEDIFNFNSILRADLGRLFPLQEPEVYSSDCLLDCVPQSVSEKATMASLSNVALKESNSNLVFLPLSFAGQELGVALFEDKAGIYEKYNLLELWPGLNSILLEKLAMYKSQLIDTRSGLLRGEALPVFLDSLLGTRMQDCCQGAAKGLASGLIFVFFELVCKSSKAQNTKCMLDGVFMKLRPEVQKDLAGRQPFFIFRMSDSTGGIALPFASKEMGQNSVLPKLSLLMKKLSANGLKGSGQACVFCALVPYKLLPAEMSIEEICKDLTDRAISVLSLARSRPDYRIASWDEIEKASKLNIVKDLCLATEQLDKLWKGTEKFSLILLSFDNAATQNEQTLLDKVRSVMPEGAVLFSLGRDFGLIYLPGKSANQAAEAAGKITERIKLESENTVSMGLADYPCLKYEKSDVPINALKALLHTSFFGPNTFTAFDAVSLNISGDMLFNTGHLDGAILEYKKGLSLDSENANLFNSLGVCYAQLGRYKRAMNYFESALNLDRDNVMAYYNLASAYSKSGLTEKSLSTLEDAIKLKGDNFDILFQMGKLLHEKKRFEEAARYWEKAAQSPDAKSFVHRYLGEIYLELELKEKAISEFKKAVKVNPQDAVSLSHLGCLYAELRGDLDLGDTLCSKAIELDPRSKAAWKTLGWIYYKKADYPRAVQFTKEAAQHDSHDFEIHYRLGIIYEKMDEMEEAKKSWRKALKLNPFCKEARQALDSGIQNSAAKKEKQPGKTKAVNTKNTK